MMYESLNPNQHLRSFLHRRLFSIQSSRITPAQPMIDKGNDQSNKEWRKDISYQLTQEASPPFLVEVDDMSGVFLCVSYLRKTEFSRGRYRQAVVRLDLFSFAFFF